LSLDPSGQVTKLQYVHKSGLSDLLGAGKTIASAPPPPKAPQTAEQKAAVIQGNSDLIYQQQRYVICAANPAACPSK
jgi:hypothetical protein